MWNADLQRKRRGGSTVRLIVRPPARSDGGGGTGTAYFFLSARSVFAVKRGKAAALVFLEKLLSRAISD